jgi:hypothetical protein
MIVDDHAFGSFSEDVERLADPLDAPVRDQDGSIKGA